MADAPDIAALLAKLPDDARPIVEVIVAVLQEQHARLLAENAELRRLLFGRKAEVVPDARRGARAKAQAAKDPTEREAERVARRRENRAQREDLPVVERLLDVPEGDLAPLSRTIG